MVPFSLFMEKIFHKTHSYYEAIDIFLTLAFVFLFGYAVISYQPQIVYLCNASSIGINASIFSSSFNYSSVVP
jgi:hypothetical protein